VPDNPSWVRDHYVIFYKILQFPKSFIAAMEIVRRCITSMASLLKECSTLELQIASFEEWVPTSNVDSIR
jgi:hypothetical protein